METIFIVEDEMVISRVLAAYLIKAGYRVKQSFDGEEATNEFDKVNPSLVLLDVMLPGKDGWSVLKYIRDRCSCPVIMLTALGEVKQKLNGFDQGADDYITKPFIAEEVVARVKAVLRRPKKISENREIMSFGNLSVDFNAHSVYLNEVELNLTPKDLLLFMFLARNANQTFTREQLIENVWGIDYEGSDRAVDLAIKRIRKTLKGWHTEEGEIKTVRGLGYRFHVNEK